jgi:hypothetical protein
VALAVTPQRPPAGRVECHGHVGDAGDRGQRRLDVGGPVAVVGHLDDQVRRVGVRERPGQPADRAHQVEAGLQHQLDRLDRRQRPPQQPAGRHGVGDPAERDQRHDALGEGGHQPHAGGGDQAERPLGAAEQRRQVVAGVVAEQASRRADRPHGGAGPDDGLDGHELAAGVAVAQHAQPAGVRGDRPAERGAVAAGEVHGVGPARRGGGPLDVADRRPGAGHELAAAGVHLGHAGEASQRHHDLAGQRHAAAHQARVAALRNEGGAGRAAGGDDARHLTRRARPHHQRRRPGEPPGPVDAVAGGHPRLGQHLGGPDDVHQGTPQGGVVEGRGVHGPMLTDEATQRRTVRPPAPPEPPSPP